MKKFETGKTYSCTSVCDSDCIWDFEILRRTAKNVWLIVDGQEVRRGIDTRGGDECVRPFGSYSMCPILRAEDVK